jgi:pyridoxamine 5'-phosphate oxidase
VSPEPADMRRDYTERGPLLEEDLAAGWTLQFATWFAEASAYGLPEPNAMIVATADRDGRPSARTVLLKGYDERGFVFFTDYRSQKGAELEQNPQASLVFFWAELERQVRITGPVSVVSREESQSYFQTRPRASQLSTWVSHQSQPIPGRKVLDDRVEQVDAQYPGEIPLPPHWGGFRVTPETVEFWQGRASRLHDRLRYTRVRDGWRVERLSP